MSVTYDKSVDELALVDEILTPEACDFLKELHFWFNTDINFH